MISFRLDDVGASSKRYEVYSHHKWNLGRIKISGNWLFLKYVPRFKQWGPYRELTTDQWRGIYDVLEEFGAKLTVAVTGAWAASESHLVPFPEKFPKQAAILKEGVKSGLIEIANHGLTHCVIRNNAFRPRWFSSNRRFHREFWDWIPIEDQERHIRTSQAILQEYFKEEVVTFVPPGNVFTDDTLDIAEKHGLRYVSCNAERKMHNNIAVIAEEGVLAFHDRDIVMNGLAWLRNTIVERKAERFCFVRDIGEKYIAEKVSGGDTNV